MNQDTKATASPRECHSYWEKVLTWRMKHPLGIPFRLISLVSPAIEPLYWICSLVRETLLEMGIALRRMRFRRTKLRGLQVVGFGSHLEVSPTGHLVPCNKTHSSIQDKLVFDLTFPWATSPVDQLMFLAAWDMGARWGESKEHTSGMDTLVEPPMVSAARIPPSVGGE